MSDAIQHVSDTSIWVAYYRALETQRPEAIFQDPYTEILVGDKASEFQNIKSIATRWTQWTVVMRTVIIDQMIRDLIDQGVKKFINIGAGLDSRPYRMNLSSNIEWIEVDFPHVIEYKTKKLEHYTPSCRLERQGLDLSDRELRKAFLKSIASPGAPIAVLTEGVLPYLTPEQVSDLSEDLTAFPEFKYWIGEYISPKSYPHLQNPKRMAVLKNAPFQFYPEDWIGFFETRGWKLTHEKYYTELSEKLGRQSPMPGFFKVLEFFLGQKWAQAYKRMSGYLMWERK